MCLFSCRKFLCDLFLLLSVFFFVIMFRNGKKERWEGRPRGMMHGQPFCSHKTKNHHKLPSETVNPYLTLPYLWGFRAYKSPRSLHVDYY